MEIQAQQKNISLDFDFKSINEQAKNAHVAVAEKVQENDNKAKAKSKRGKAKGKAKPKHIPAKNFMLAMMEAVEKDQDTMSSQQITDAKATEEAVQLEANLYTHWMGELKYITSEIWGAKGDSSTLKKYMAIYSEQSAEGQSMESQQDGAVQADQGQTTSDATNLQMKAQMIQGINSVLSTLVNLLGRITA